MPLVNCISIVIDEYNIHFDDSYCKYNGIDGVGRGVSVAFALPVR